jgi:hypothetical protein
MQVPKFELCVQRHGVCARAGEIKRPMKRGVVDAMIPIIAALGKFDMKRLRASNISDDVRSLFRARIFDREHNHMSNPQRAQANCQQPRHVNKRIERYVEFEAYANGKQKCS